MARFLRSTGLSLCFLQVFLLCNVAFSYVIPKQEINEALITEIKNIAPEYSYNEIVAIAELKDYQEKYFSVDTEDYQIKAKIANKNNITKKLHARVYIYEKEQLKNVLRLRFDLTIYDDVYYAKEDCEKGTKITPELLYLKKADVLKHSQKLINKEENFKDKILISKLTADEPLYAWKFRRKPLVTVGDKILVTVIYDDNIQLKMPAKVLQQGFIDDKIRVRLIDTGKIFKAKIIDQDNYEIRL